MLNPTQVLRYLKMMMGASHFPLAFDDEAIMDVIRFQTIPTYSSYFPYQMNLTINPERDRIHAEFNTNNGFFFLNLAPGMENVEILSVHRLFRQNGIMNSYNGYPYMSVNTQDKANIQMITDLSSFTEIPFTFKFIPPNRLEVFPKITGNMPFYALVNTTHPETLHTIPFNMREDFLKLCLYDVQYAMYQVFKHYDGLSTAVGSISLKTEEFEAAISNRDELLQKWETKYLLEPTQKKIWIS